MIGGVAVLAIIVAIIAYGLHKKKSNVASFSNGKPIRILFFFSNGDFIYLFTFCFYYHFLLVLGGGGRG